MFNAVASVVRDCDIKELTSFHEENQEALTLRMTSTRCKCSLLSRRGFHFICTFVSQQASFLPMNPRRAFLCHERTLCGSGHWWSFCREEDAKVTIFDCLAGNHSFTLPRNFPRRNCPHSQPHLLCAAVSANGRAAVLSSLKGVVDIKPVKSFYEALILWRLA